MLTNVRNKSPFNHCLLTYITNFHPFVIRPHGSSFSGDPGLVKLAGRGGKSACQLFCGWRTERGRRVHLGIPRTTGELQLYIFLLYSHSLQSFMALIMLKHHVFFSNEPFFIHKNKNLQIPGCL